MAKLVGVCRSDDYPLERRQFPLSMDDSLELIVQFPDMCIGCRDEVVDEEDVAMFIHKFEALTSAQVQRTTFVNKNDIVNQLSHNVQCVGCRRSVERMFEEMAKGFHRAIEPLEVINSSTISIMPQYLNNARSIYSLFYVRGSCSALELNSKVRKGKRCVLHSIDVHKTKSFWSWQDVWELSSDECREEITLVDCDTLHVTLDEYLRKHRFCSDCRNKVTYAFKILTREVDGTSDKGFCPSLYEGLKVCEKERHLHVTCDEKFIRSLIERAEPELAGNQREQHAKTMDVAQEEVLTCLGIYLYDRFFRLLQKLKVEEKSWLILYSLSVDVLRRNMEAEFEQMFGDNSIENICSELSSVKDDDSKTKQSRRRKKKCKNSSPSVATQNETVETKTVHNSCVDVAVGNQDTNHNIVLATTCQCDSNTCHNRPVLPPTVTTTTKPHCADCHVPKTSSHCQQNSLPLVAHGDVTDERACKSCTTQMSFAECGALECAQDSVHRTSSSHGFTASSCNGVGCNWLDACDGAAFVHSPVNTRYVLNGAAGDAGNMCNRPKTLSLQEMLKTTCFDEFEIDEEDIQRFKADEKRLATERQQLRQTLRQKFANMQQRCVCPTRRDHVTPCNVAKCNVSVVTSMFAEVSTE